MEYPLTLPGFEGRRLVVQTGGLFSGPKLMIDGKPAPKGPKRRQLVLRRDDGAEIIAQLRQSNFVDPVPQVIIDGQTITLADPLKWYHWLWAGLPFALVFVGGLLGALAGGLATYVNGRIFRSDLNGFAKYVVTGFFSVSAVIGYFVLAIIVRLAIGG